MTLASTYILRHIQNCQGQEIENVYMFDHILGTGNSGNLAFDFETNWLPLIAALQTSAMAHKGLIVYNMSDLSDFVTLPLAGNGTYGPVEQLPTFAAVGYSFKVDTRAVRPGSKRIAGIPEAVTSLNTVADAGYLALVESLRLAFQGTMVGVSNSWKQIVVKRTKTAIPGTLPVKYAYRLPTTELDYVSGTVTAALANVILTSQVSRKG
jgi:hypothetical protein